MTSIAAYNIIVIGEKFMAEWMYYVLSVLFVPLFVLTIIAQIKVSVTYNKYKNVKSNLGISAADCARKMLDAKGLTSTRVLQTKGGSMSDYFDPRNNTVNLSNEGYNSTSIASIAVAAHEVGHAYQHADESYAPMRIRSKLVPIVNIGSHMVLPLFIIGVLVLVFNQYSMVGTVMLWLAVCFYFLSTLFYLVTLPIEINASKRALATISANGYLDQSEMPAAKELLTAAAWTYVAGLLTSIYYFLNFLLRVIMITRRD